MTVAVAGDNYIVLGVVYSVLKLSAGFAGKHPRAQRVEGDLRRRASGELLQR
jgi:hypothetical protein